MLGEGVSIKRLKYRIHATNIRASLSFMQDLGRLLRLFPKDPPESVETLIPAHPVLIELAIDVLNDVAHIVREREQDETGGDAVERKERPDKIDHRTSEVAGNYKVSKNEVTELNYQDVGMELTADELAERWNTKASTVNTMWNKYKNTYKFHRWSKKQDPEDVAWERADKKKGRSWLFIPVLEPSIG